MMRITVSAFTVFGSLLLTGEYIQESKAMETGATSPPAIVGAAPEDDLFEDDLFEDDLFEDDLFEDDLFEDGLFESMTDSTDVVPDNSKPAPESSSESDIFGDPSQPSSDSPTVETPKKLDDPAPAGDRKTTETESDDAPSGLKSEASEDKASADTESAQPESSTNTKPATPNLTPELLELREQVRDCLGYYFNDHESVVDHSPWGIMHVLIAYGVDTEVYAQNTKTNAIGYLCWNGACRGQQLFYVNRGKLEARLGPGVQGHDGQFLAMMAQSKVKADYPMHVDGRDFTIASLIDYEKRTCEAGTELTFKLIGLSHYLDTDATWKNQNGEDWSIPRLIKEELAQPIIGAACGGTHRLMGFNYAVRKREKDAKPMTGQWMRARKFLDEYFEYTFYLQNDEGSFSTDSFRWRNPDGDINQKVETTGHILEWFVASLSDEQLRDPRVIKAVKYLSNLMLRNRNNQWEIGPKGHALHALAIYDERVFGDKPGTRSAVLSRKKKLHHDDRSQR